jgi:hypothetical protein
MEHIRSIFACSCRTVFRATEWSDHATTSFPARVLAEYSRLPEELGIESRLIPALDGDGHLLHAGRRV